MARARMTQYVVEALVPTDTTSPATPTGAGISQYVVEVLYSFVGKTARMSQYVVEVLYSDDDEQTDPSPPGGVGTDRVHSFGYAG